ncbi:hypothetical protein JCM10450v2_001058 [Rhodotorula kratochvilovae]
MHPPSYIAQGGASPDAPSSAFAFASPSVFPFPSSSSADAPLPLYAPSVDMPPAYEGASSSMLDPSASTTAKSTALAVSPPSPQPSMSLSTRRSAGPPTPLVTPPPYCASPPLVPIPVLGLTAQPAAIADDAADEDEYLALATPAQRSYFVTLSDMFEAAAQAAGAGSPQSGKGEKGGVEVRPMQRRAGEAAGPERDAGCFSSCVVS